MLSCAIKALLLKVLHLAQRRQWDLQAVVHASHACASHIQQLLDINYPYIQGCNVASYLGSLQ